MLGENSFCCTDTAKHCLILKNLPSLYTIQSNNDSFMNVTDVVCTNVPNCNYVRLHHSFQRVENIKSYQCENCSRDLQIIYPALLLLKDVYEFLKKISNESYVSDMAREKIEGVNVAMKKYSEDVYRSRLDMLMDCKQWIDTMDSALKMDKESQYSNLHQEKKKKGKVLTERALCFAGGILAIGAGVFAGPLLATTLPGLIAGSIASGFTGGLVASGAYAKQDDIKNEHESIIKQYNNGYDRDVDLIKEIEVIKKRYKVYFDLI